MIGKDPEVREAELRRRVYQTVDKVLYGMRQEADAARKAARPALRLVKG